MNNLPPFRHPGRSAAETRDPAAPLANQPALSGKAVNRQG